MSLPLNDCSKKVAILMFGFDLLISHDILTLLAIFALRFDIGVF